MGILFPFYLPDVKLTVREDFGSSAQGLRLGNLLWKEKKTQAIAKGKLAQTLVHSLLPL